MSFYEEPGPDPVRVFFKALLEGRVQLVPNTRRAFSNNANASYRVVVTPAVQNAVDPNQQTITSD